MKDRIFMLSERLPLLGRAADPFMAMILSVFAVLTLLAVALPGQIFWHDDDARSHVLQLAGGFLVLGGFYFAAVGLRANRASQHADRLVSTLALLASEDEATRAAAILLLENMAEVSPNLPQDSASRRTTLAQRRAILVALEVAKAGRTTGERPEP